MIITDVVIRVTNHDSEEIRSAKEMLSPWLDQILVPPSSTIGLVRYESPPPQEEKMGRPWRVFFCNGLESVGARITDEGGLILERCIKRERKFTLDSVRLGPQETKELVKYIIGTEEFPATLQKKGKEVK